MARPKTKKSDFIRQVLGANAGASHKEVAQAWKKSGRKGTIGGALFYNVRGRLAGKKPGRKPGRKAVARRRVGRPRKTAGDGYLQIETALDQLVAQATQMGDTGLADALRASRRAVSAKLV